MDDGRREACRASEPEKGAAPNGPANREKRMLMPTQGKTQDRPRGARTSVPVLRNGPAAPPTPMKEATLSKSPGKDDTSTDR